MQVLQDLVSMTTWSLKRTLKFYWASLCLLLSLLSTISSQGLTTANHHHLLTKRSTSYSIPCCSDPGIPKNGIRIGSQFSVGSEVNFGCSAGYILRGGSASLTCRYGEWNVVEWDGERPQCVVSHPIIGSSDPCGPPPEPTTFSYITSYTVGSSVSYSCLEEYSPTHGNEKLTCTDGQWWGESLQCARVGECEDEGDIINGQRILEVTSEVDSVYFVCNEGYLLLGYRQLHCDSNGRWSGSWPQCARAPPNCGDPGRIRNGQRVVSGTTPGSTVSYHCEQGYVLTGTRERTCSNEGMWSGNTPACNKVYCNAPSRPVHGTVTHSSTEYGATVTYSCNPGHVLLGASETSCNEAGAWTAPPPQCMRVKCGLPKLPINGFVRSSGVLLGDEAIYSCLRDHGLMGTSLRTCQEDGSWSGTTPFCQSGVCDTLSQPEHGIVSVTGTIPGATALYSCNQGYRLSDPGRAQRTCGLHSVWSGSAPTCQPITCPTLTPRQHVAITFTDESNYDSLAVYTCQPGSIMIGGQERTYRRCQANGQWTGQPAFCFEWRCSPLASPHNGRVEMTGTKAGNEASYMCEEGHKLSFGDQIRTCTLKKGWSGLEPCCVQVSSAVCDELSSPATSTVVVTGLQEGDQARYTCNEGLTQTAGNSFRVCLPSGFWSGEELLCSATCPPLTAPANGTVTLSGNRPGDRALYSCNTDFVLVETGSGRECLENGSWSGTPSTCNSAPMGPRSCKNLTAPENGVLNMSLGVRSGAMAIFSCKEGYVLIGTALRICDLDKDGGWSGTQPSCQPKDCGPLSPPANGSIQVSLTIFGSVSLYRCNEGYVLTTPSTRVCLADGRWSGTNPVCQPVDCGILSAPQKGFMSVTTTTLGSLARYRCETGYELTGPDLRECLTDGSWSLQVPVCQLVDCGALDPPQRGRVFSSGTTFGSWASYSCETNYKLVGPVRRVCQEDGVWSSTPPTCEVVDCGVLDPPQRGRVFLSGTTFGSWANYSCETNYKLVGLVRRVCQEDGVWSSTPPTCEELQCPELVSPTGGEVVVSDRTVGAMATYSCSLGYSLIGPQVLECLEIEEWSDEPPTCQLNVCPELPAPESGTVRVGGRVVGGQTMYECEPGLVLRGDVTRTCQENGQWTGEQPICEVVVCPVLSSITNGRVIVSTRTAGSRAVYLCNRGFEVLGVITRLCGEDGRWTGEESVCIKGYCDVRELISPTNGTVTYTNNTIGSTATYSCIPGYRLVGDAQSVCSVQSNSETRWSGTPPICLKIVCPTLRNPVNGAVFFTHSCFGGGALYTCNLGFRQPTGLLKRTCRENSQWDGEEPSCDPLPSTVVCPTLSDPHNGDIVITTTTVGSSVSYTCRRGYRLDGQTVRECQSNGQWTGSDPVCSFVDCGTLDAPPNGSVTTAQGTTVNRVARYFCERGFLIVGLNFRVCQRDNNWSGMAPTCQVIDCGPLDSPTNGQVVTSEGTLFERQAVYSCRLGYEVNGLITRVCQVSQEWSGVEPTCSLIGTVPDSCGDPSTPLNGLRDLTATTIGSIVEYSCIEGFALSGRKTRICRSNQQWSDALPTCNPVMCPRLANPNNGNVLLVGLTVGSRATYFCHPGFNIRRTDIIFRECLSSGEWSGEEPLCIPEGGFECSSLRAISNGNVTMSGLSVGSVAEYECEPGFSLTGLATRTCEPAGVWSGLEPVCTGVECGDPGKPVDGRAVMSDFSLNSRVYAVCNDGFQTSDPVVLQCTTNGTWSVPMPTCTPVPSTAADPGGCRSSQVLDSSGRLCDCGVERELTSCCRYRQDWTTLSLAEKQRYINAVKTVSTSPEFQPLYNELVKRYKDSFNTIVQYTMSETSQFFPWHRYFLLEYENLLKMVDSYITIPYWDWTLNPNKPYESSVFDPDSGFGDSADNVTMCVTSGPFREDVFTVTPSAKSTCLKREYAAFQYPSRSHIEKQFLSLGAEDFDQFHSSIQLFVSLSTKCYVGGHMCLPEAANDPLFLLLLARLDLILSRWQNMDENRAAVRYRDEKDLLMLTFDESLAVSDFSANSALPYGGCVRYAPLQEVDERYTDTTPPSGGPDLPTFVPPQDPITDRFERRSAELFSDDKRD